MSKPDKPAIMEAHGKEIKNIEFLAGLDAQLIQGQEILKERLLTIPNGWRNFRLLLHHHREGVGWNLCNPAAEGVAPHGPAMLLRTGNYSPAPDD